MALKPVTSPDVEAPAIQLTVDGQQVEAKQGVSLYDVISQTGKIIPAMCYHYTFDPFGSCGMCLVMVEGKKAPVRSCTAKAEAGMVVRCEGEDLFLARKKAVEKHLTIHPLDCPVCDADGHCELQDMAFQHGVTNLVNAKPKGLPEDRRSLVLDFNMNRCILCGECINICKDVQMVDALQFLERRHHPRGGEGGRGPRLRVLRGLPGGLPCGRHHEQVFQVRLQAVAVEEDDEHVRLLRRRLPDVHRDQREGRPAGDVAALLEEQVGRSRGDRRGPRGPVRARAVRVPVYRQQGTAGRPVGPHGRGVRAALVV